MISPWLSSPLIPATSAQVCLPLKKQGLFIPLIPSTIYSNTPQHKLKERFPQITWINLSREQRGPLFFFFLIYPGPFPLGKYLYLCSSLAFPWNSPIATLLGVGDRQTAVPRASPHLFIHTSSLILPQCRPAGSRSLSEYRAEHIKASDAQAALNLFILLSPS